MNKYCKAKVRDKEHFYKENTFEPNPNFWLNKEGVMDKLMSEFKRSRDALMMRYFGLNKINNHSFDCVGVGRLEILPKNK